MTLELLDANAVEEVLEDSAEEAAFLAVEEVRSWLTDTSQPRDSRDSQLRCLPVS